ncbi:hypothetical protein C8J57DRAFT_1580495 [Mycena rebaudengoi]|nr:hypothetical protein C8J57DRAFT_1580495 [Mycena rebaudengoi]
MAVVASRQLEGWLKRGQRVQEEVKNGSSTVIHTDCGDRRGGVVKMREAVWRKAQQREVLGTGKDEGMGGKRKRVVDFCNSWHSSSSSWSWSGTTSAARPRWQTSSAGAAHTHRAELASISKKGRQERKTHQRDPSPQIHPPHPAAAREPNEHAGIQPAQRHLAHLLAVEGAQLRGRGRAQVEHLRAHHPARVVDELVLRSLSVISGLAARAESRGSRDPAQDAEGSDVEDENAADGTSGGHRGTAGHECPSRMPSRTVAPPLLRRRRLSATHTDSRYDACEWCDEELGRRVYARRRTPSSGRAAVGGDGNAQAAGGEGDGEGSVEKGVSVGLWRTKKRGRRTASQGGNFFCGGAVPASLREQGCAGHKFLIMRAGQEGGIILVASGETKPDVVWRPVVQADGLESTVDQDGAVDAQITVKYYVFFFGQAYLQAYQKCMGSIRLVDLRVLRA